MAYCRQMAEDAGINPDLFERQINQESGFNPNAGSPAGAQGISQIVAKWHPGVNPWDPFDSLHYAANLMKSYLDEYDGDWTLALVRYNGGQGGVLAWQSGTPYLESQHYVRAILG